MRHLFFLLALCSCSETPPDNANPDARCHPLAVGDCLLPWPSSYYLKKDSATASGYRLALPDGVLPLDQTGRPMDATYLNRMDGFSPAGLLVANLKARLDPAQLPSSTDLAQSVAPSSTVQLI